MGIGPFTVHQGVAVVADLSVLWRIGPVISVFLGQISLVLQGNTDRDALERPDGPVAVLLPGCVLPAALPASVVAPEGGGFRRIPPKQGIVTPRTLFLSSPSESTALTVTKSARQESRPPEIPTTHFFAYERSILCLSPWDWIERIVSQRFSLSIVSEGTKG